MVQRQHLRSEMVSIVSSKAYQFLILSRRSFRRGSSFLSKIKLSHQLDAKILEFWNGLFTIFRESVHQYQQISLVFPLVANSQMFARTFLNQR